MVRTAARAARAWGSTASPAAVSRTARRDRSSSGLSQLALQALDLCADRGLSDVDPLCRPGEVGLLGDGDQILQLPKFHNN